MSRLRILLLAPDANPQNICGPLIGYSQAQALAELHDVTLVVRSPWENPERGNKGAIPSVEVGRLPRLDGIFPRSVGGISKHHHHSHSPQALRSPCFISS